MVPLQDTHTDFDEKDLGVTCPCPKYPTHIIWGQSDPEFPIVSFPLQVIAFPPSAPCRAKVAFSTSKHQQYSLEHSHGPIEVGWTLEVLPPTQHRASCPLHTARGGGRLHNVLLCDQLLSHWPLPYNHNETGIESIGLGFKIGFMFTVVVLTLVLHTCRVPYGFC
jgi:hypothetical protein